MSNKLLISGVALALGLSLLGLLSKEAPSAAPAPQLGALSSPDIQSQWLRVGGVLREFRSAALATATTTPCSLQSPAATSTLAHASLRITTATSTATTWTLAKAGNAFATTTLLNTFSLGSGAQGAMVATSTTVVGVDNQTVIAPSQFLVWGVAGTVISGTANLNGFCQAEFIVL